jgi:CheY-like chemotaxis protein
MEKMRLLMVDDSPNIREIVRYGLLGRFLNIEVDEAASGNDAKTKLGNRQYNLIICDWEMPDIKGDRLLQWIRGHPVLNTIPFIMLTAKNERSNIMKALELGASAYLIKPFTIAGLIQSIRSVVDKFDSRESARFAAYCPVSLTFRNNTVRGNLIDISLGGLFGNFQRKELFPGILENVIVDIEPDDGPGISGINGFVIRIQAAKAVMDTDYINMAIKFLDIGDEIKDKLVHFFNMLKLKI